MIKYDESNVFARILRGEIPCDKVYEDEYTLAFYDINPIADIHIIVIPKGKFISYDDFIDSSFDVSHFFRNIKKIAGIFNLHKTGYKLITNHGLSAEQEVFHFHVHILGGSKILK